MGNIAAFDTKFLGGIYEHLFLFIIYRRKIDSRYKNHTSNCPVERALKIKVFQPDNKYVQNSVTVESTCGKHIPKVYNPNDGPSINPVIAMANGRISPKY